MEQTEPAKLVIPLDIFLSLLTSEELVMAIEYATAYAARHGVNAHDFIAACEREQIRREALQESECV